MRPGIIDELKWVMRKVMTVRIHNGELRRNIVEWLNFDVDVVHRLINDKFVHMSAISEVSEVDYVTFL